MVDITIVNGDYNGLFCKPTYNWGAPSCTHVWLYWYLGLAYSTHKFCNASCDGCTKLKRPAVWSACFSCDMQIILSAHYVHFCMHVMCGLTWTWGIRKRFDVSFSSSCSINIATLGCNMGGYTHFQKPLGTSVNTSSTLKELTCCTWY